MSFLSFNSPKNNALEKNWIEFSEERKKEKRMQLRVHVHTLPQQEIYSKCIFLLLIYSHKVRPPILFIQMNMINSATFNMISFQH